MTDYLLILSFDFEQLTQSLDYRLTHLVNWNYDQSHHIDVRLQRKINPDLRHPHFYDPAVLGPNAGTFNFNHGDKLGVQVQGFVDHNRKSRGSEYEIDHIAGCVLVSIKEPGVRPLSLFHPNNAIAHFSDWAPNTWHYESYTTHARTSQKLLEVKAKEGQWKMSGYLSIVLKIDGKPVPMLYYFDPESSAGGGLGVEP